MIKLPSAPLIDQVTPALLPSLVTAELKVRLPPPAIVAAGGYSETAIGAQVEALMVTAALPLEFGLATEVAVTVAVCTMVLQRPGAEYRPVELRVPTPVIIHVTF